MLSFSPTEQLQTVKQLDNVETVVADLLNGPQKSKWKLYQTAINENLNTNTTDYDCQKIRIYRLIENKSKQHGAVWKAIAYLPYEEPQKYIEYYSLPQHQLEYDYSNTMRKLFRFPIKINAKNDDNADTEYNINVAVTNPRLNGWIKPTLSITTCCVKYSKKTNSHCCLGTYLSKSSMKSIIKQLPMKSVVFQNNIISFNNLLYWAAKPFIVPNMKLIKITYIIQANNDMKWIPTNLIQKGLIQTHMIPIFKHMAKWTEIKSTHKEEQKEEQKDIEAQIVDVAIALPDQEHLSVSPTTSVTQAVVCMDDYVTVDDFEWITVDEEKDHIQNVLNDKKLILVNEAKKHISKEMLNELKNDNVDTNCCIL